MTQITQSFNPGIHRRIQKTLLNPNVLNWLASPRCVPVRMNVSVSSKGPWAFLNDGDSISFPITSRNLAMEYHFIQREGSITIERFMLVENLYLTHDPTLDGPLRSDAESIFLL